MPALPPLAALQAPAHWQTVEFISDLHLHPAEPATVAAWQTYLAGTQADAVFILGDLFEVWVGDDVLDDAASFESRCTQILRNTAQRRELFFMHGNRDFLIGSRFAQHCSLQLLDDPTVLQFHNQRWLLSHGDALCLDDTDYMQFRAQVRQADWQNAFLAQPLAERQAIARGMRQQSEARKQSGMAYADVDTAEAIAWLQAAQAPTLIHGHTHKPATHTLTDTLQRVVLSDWDLAATPPRAEALRLSAQGLQRVALV